jgi:hypothetical protein
MSRRSTMPGAEELFRTTGAAPDAPPRLSPVADLVDGVDALPGRRRSGGRPPRRPTGRERHEEKITVYVSQDELLGLEQVRLDLRAEHGLAVDRGRVVREALAVLLADFDAQGETSILVRRLRGL